MSVADKVLETYLAERNANLGRLQATKSGEKDHESRWYQTYIGHTGIQGQVNTARRIVRW